MATRRLCSIRSDTRRGPGVDLPSFGRPLTDAGKADLDSIPFTADERLVAVVSATRTSSDRPTPQVDWAKYRKLFPAVVGSTYLNTAGGAPVSLVAAQEGIDYYETSVIEGDVHWDDWLRKVEQVRGKLATFLNARADELAFLPNTSAGINIVTRMVEASVKDRGAVVAVDNEFPSCTLPWLQRGYDLRFVPTATDGRVQLQQLRQAVGDRPGVLVISYVQYLSGFRHQLSELGQLCRDLDLIFVVDATQAIGAFRIDVRQSNIDFLAFSGYKWANAGYSIGGLYVRQTHLRPDELPVVGWLSAEDPYELLYDRLCLNPRAAALEGGHPLFAGIFTLGAALDLIDEIGIDNIEARILKLTHYLNQRLVEQGVEILSATDDKHRSGITLIAVDDAAAMVSQLEARNIFTSQRGGRLRISLHYYNDRQDIDRFIDALAECTTAP